MWSVPLSISIELSSSVNVLHAHGTINIPKGIFLFDSTDRIDLINDLYNSVYNNISFVPCFYHQLADFKSISITPINEEFFTHLYPPVDLLPEWIARSSGEYRVYPSHCRSRHCGADTRWDKWHRWRWWYRHDRYEEWIHRHTEYWDLESARREKPAIDWIETSCSPSDRRDWWRWCADSLLVAWHKDCREMHGYCSDLVSIQMSVEAVAIVNTHTPVADDKHHATRRMWMFSDQ